MRTRAGVEVYTHLPVDPATAAVGAANVPALYADMAKYTVTDGITFDLQSMPARPAVGPSLPGKSGRAARRSTCRISPVVAALRWKPIAPRRESIRASA